MKSNKRVKVYNWPKTSDNEFSKRMFIQFMCAFFIHICITIAAECFMGAGGAALSVFQISIPVYTTIFAAVIVKGGVENVFKGKTTLNITSGTDDEEGSNG